jgi:hypothetical protein
LPSWAEVRKVNADYICSRYVNNSNRSDKELLSECNFKLTEMNNTVEMSAVLDTGCANLLIQNIPMFTATLNLVQAYESSQCVLEVAFVHKKATFKTIHPC